jgi:hypothetical protein
MKKFVIIVHSRRIDVGDDWYLCKGNPRLGRTGNSYSAMTPQLEGARKFNSRKEAERILKDFTPAIFSGSEKIIEVEIKK